MTNGKTRTMASRAFVEVVLKANEVRAKMGKMEARQKLGDQRVILRDGRDPMLMSEKEIETSISDFEAEGNKVAAAFLQGVLFARVSIQAAGGAA